MPATVSCHSPRLIRCRRLIPAMLVAAAALAGSCSAQPPITGIESTVSAGTTAAAGTALASTSDSAMAASTGSAAIAATGTHTTDAPAAAVPLVIIGDSYTAGSAVGGNGQANWTAVATGLLDEGGYPVDPTVLGLSGSGYVRVGGQGVTFTDGVPKVVTDQAALVVIFGSINDGSSAPQAVATSAALALQRIKATAPEALIVIIGPQWIDGDPPPNLLAIRDALASIVNADPQATFVDPLAEGWFGGASAALIGSDGLHPTDAGHRHLAELIAPRIAAAIDTIRSGE